jgi:hypothetical protein
MYLITDNITERASVQDIDGHAVAPGRYMLMSGNVDTLMVEVTEDEITAELIVSFDHLPFEPQRYRLAELQPGVTMRRLPDDYPRDGTDLDL